MRKKPIYGKDIICPECKGIGRKEYKFIDYSGLKIPEGTCRRCKGLGFVSKKKLKER